MHVKIMVDSMQLMQAILLNSAVWCQKNLEENEKN